MKTDKKNAGIKVNAGVKAGGVGQPGVNHSRSALNIKAGIKAGTLIQANHNRQLLALS